MDEQPSAPSNNTEQFQSQSRQTTPTTFTSREVAQLHVEADEQAYRYPELAIQELSQVPNMSVPPITPHPAIEYPANDIFGRPITPPAATSAGVANPPFAIVNGQVTDLNAVGARVPPNTPASSHETSPISHRQYGAISEALADSPSISANKIDYRGLTYFGTVDENLICPICHAAFVDPVDTLCDHTFCRDCITSALAVTENCPIDRGFLPCDQEFKLPHKLLRNQLDGLPVDCPKCHEHVPRSLFASHLQKYCPESLVWCPVKTCDLPVKRKLVSRGCLHYEVICLDCGEVHLETEMQDHREGFCKDRFMTCDYCAKTIVRCKELEHAKECSDKVVPCEWAGYGCRHEAMRKIQHLHECSFKMVGTMAEMLKKEISGLRGEVKTLTEKNQLQERRIKFLENGQKDVDRPFVISDVQSHSLSPRSESLDSPHEYLLSLVESQENKVNQLLAGVTELEARQTVMVLNETMPLKDQIAELRSNQGVLGMHVRWLLNIRNRENQMRGGNNMNGGSGNSGGPRGDGSMPRRLSDSTREATTKL